MKHLFFALFLSSPAFGSYEWFTEMLATLAAPAEETRPEAFNAACRKAVGAFLPQAVIFKYSTQIQDILAQRGPAAVAIVRMLAQTPLKDAAIEKAVLELPVDSVEMQRAVFAFQHRTATKLSDYWSTMPPALGSQDPELRATALRILTAKRSQLTQEMLAEIAPLIKQWDSDSRQSALAILIGNIGNFRLKFLATALGAALFPNDVDLVNGIFAAFTLESESARSTALEQLGAVPTTHRSQLEATLQALKTVERKTSKSSGKAGRCSESIRDSKRY